ncbi:MAG TPA: Sir2 family NAD-dependent protein deacetylase, partial [Candidatus Dormibacteraeota bacterium]|nr:Sir2 family NAD-dependent protein deacetylase [Candidatus Dormibacteraeota bacterium]
MTTATDTALDQAAALLRPARSAIAFTGAGISVESGIPHFRGEGGLWTKFDPYKVAHIDTFRKDPAQYWTYSLNHRRTDAEPNPAHRALVDLEQRGQLRAVVTQNTDGLHQKAGSGQVIELHGSS